MFYLSHVKPADDDDYYYDHDDNEGIAVQCLFFYLLRKPIAYLLPLVNKDTQLLASCALYI